MFNNKLLEGIVFLILGAFIYITHKPSGLSDALRQEKIEKYINIRSEKQKISPSEIKIRQIIRIVVAIILIFIGILKIIISLV